MVLAWAGQYPVILKAAHFQPRAGEVTWPGCLPAAPVILTVLMVRLVRCNRGIGKGEQAENDNDGSEQTPYTVHVHGSSPVLSVLRR